MPQIRRCLCEDSFYAPDLNVNKVRQEKCGCPVEGCTEELKVVHSQWGDMPFCPRHCIRIHPSSPTFVYYNGETPEDEKVAAKRNIRFEKEWFAERVLGSTLKAESHRIVSEKSEDALTWDVCAFLAGKPDGLRTLARFLMEPDAKVPKGTPQLYLWGLRIDFSSNGPCARLPELDAAREDFEADVRRFHTEPDLMLLFPEELLLLCEVKFASPNGIAGNTAPKAGEKPCNMADVLHQYDSVLVRKVINKGAASKPFYIQLYRNLVFAVHMADSLGVPWRVANLVSRTQFDGHRGAGYLEPTRQIRALLDPNRRMQFTYRTWEDFWTQCVQGDEGMGELKEYFRKKSAFLARAFDLPD
jgi:hypothetical protein